MTSRQSCLISCYPAPRAQPVNPGDVKVPRATPVVPTGEEKPEPLPLDALAADELPTDEDGPIEDDAPVPRATLVLPGESDGDPGAPAVAPRAERAVPAMAGRSTAKPAAPNVRG